MVVVLGSSGYVGKAFCKTLESSGKSYTGLSRKQLDYTKFSVLTDFLDKERPDLLVNAAGYTGKPNVDACETAKADALIGNSALPLTISHACQTQNVPWIHVSSGCIFSGARVTTSGTPIIVTDLMQRQVQEAVETESESIQGFSEQDPPNFSFRSPPCSFYSGTKALGEELLEEDSQVYICRLRVPFDERDSSRNYISKLMRYSKVYNNVNSLSHLTDFVEASLGLAERKASFGLYNVTNPGYVTARSVVSRIKSKLGLDREFEFWGGDADFYGQAAVAPRSNCVLDPSKLLSTGVTMRPVEDAVDDALDRWVWEKKTNA